MYLDKRSLIINTLKNKKYKLTESRIKIIDCLLDNTHFHSIESLTNHLKNNINVKSIYSTIELLIHEGIVHEYIVDDKRNYEIIFNAKDHIHLFDNEHALIDTLPASKEMLDIIKHNLIKKGYKLINLNIEAHVEIMQKDK